MWSDWLVFCDCGFSLSALWWRRIRGLWKLPDWRNWMSGKLGLALMGEAMLRKSLIQFSEDGWGCVPSLSFTWGQAMVDVMKIMGTSLKRSHAHTATLSAPNPAASHCRPMPPPETTGHLWASLGHSLMGSLLLLPGSLCVQGSVCVLWESVSLVLCKFWQLYGGLMATSSKRAYAIPRSAAPRAPAPVAVHCWPILPQETLKHNSVSVSVGSLGDHASTQTKALKLLKNIY